MTRSTNDNSIPRRQFLRHAVHTAAGVAALRLAGPAASGAAEKPRVDDLVRGISRDTVLRGGPGRTTWFHPRGCAVPGPSGPRVLITLQSITGSDFFGPVHWMESADLGRTWTTPEPIPSLGRTPFEGDILEGTCDVVPEYHAPTRSVLAMGHNVFYKPKGFFLPQPPRWSVYVVRDPAGRWSDRRRLVWNDPRNSGVYSCGCAQRLVLPGGDVLIPIHFRTYERADSSFTTLRAAFDGRTLAVRQMGTELRLPVKRGLLEPSLASWRGRIYVTLRAEDDRGYVSSCEDGMRWEPIRPWCWDDGQPLVMSTTQQHWLVHSDALYLVYTRKAEENQHVMRWRAPLYMAKLDPKTLRLMRATEQIVLPLEGDPPSDPKRVYHLGNFHVTAVSPDESWVTVGSVATGTYLGDVLIGRVRWARPNRLFGA